MRDRSGSRRLLNSFFWALERGEGSMLSSSMVAVSSSSWAVVAVGQETTLCCSFLAAGESVEATPGERGEAGRPLEAACSERCSTDFLRGEYLREAREEGVSASSRCSLLLVSRGLGLSAHTFVLGVDDALEVRCLDATADGLMVDSSLGEGWARGVGLLRELGAWTGLDTGLLMGEDMTEERTEEMAEESSSKVKFRGEAARTMAVLLMFVLLLLLV